MSKTLIFQRPKNGAVRDVKELEYICALHQSLYEDLVPAEGYITANCIKSLILSRHGIEVSEKELVDLGIVQDLGGDLKYRNKLDIPQLASLLFIPKWKRAAEATPSDDNDDNDDDNDDDNVFEQLLTLIRENIGLSEDDPPPELTKDLMACILATCHGAKDSDGCGNGDEDEATDRMLTEMIRQAGGEGVPLDAHTLRHALTSDLDAYKTEWETSSSLFIDDFITMIDGGLDELMKGACCNTITIKMNDGSSLPNGDDVECSKVPAMDVKEELSATLTRLSDAKSASVLDLTADTFNSDTFFIILFLSMILVYISYGFLGFEKNCNSTSVAFGCHLGADIMSWLFVFVNLGVAGSIYCMAASSGNSNFKECPLYKKIVGMVLVVFFTILSFTGIVEPFMTRTEVPYLQWAPYATLVVGVLLICQQGVYVLKTLSPRIRFLLHQRSAGVRKELHTKHAQVYKVDGMFQHALELHNLKGRRGPTSRRGFSAQLSKELRTANSSNSVATSTTIVPSQDTSALLSYQSKQNEFEVVGGFWWTIKQMINGYFWDKEGVFLGARMLAAHFAQFIAIGLFLGLFLTAIRYVKESDEIGGSSTVVSSLLPAGYRRSLYFNASGSFLFTESEITVDFLTSNNLEFAYDFDNEDLTLYQEASRDRFLRSVLVAVTTSQVASTNFFELDAAEGLADSLSQTIQNTTGVDLNLISEYAVAYASFEGSLVAFVYEEARKRVTKNEVLSAVWLGGVFAMFTMLSNVLVYVPSYICQTLQYRYGVKGVLLTCEQFQSQRRNEVWNVTQLFGLTFWSLLISGVMVGTVLGYTLFLLVWSETSKYTLPILAFLFAIIVTWLLKRVILAWAEKRSYSALYRTDLFFSNFITIFMEVRLTTFAVKETKGAHPFCLRF